MRDGRIAIRPYRGSRSTTSREMPGNRSCNDVGGKYTQGWSGRGYGAFVILRQQEAGSQWPVAQLGASPLTE